jgi:hypothetical protein
MNNKVILENTIFQKEEHDCTKIQKIPKESQRGLNLRFAAKTAEYATPTTTVTNLSFKLRKNVGGRVSKLGRLIFRESQT